VLFHSNPFPDFRHPSQMVALPPSAPVSAGADRVEVHHVSAL
jgi:hypothetical protein